jgi:hypothetical protein
VTFTGLVTFAGPYVGFNLDSTANFASDGSGNCYVLATTANSELASTDANAIANNLGGGFVIDNNWTLSGSNPSTDLLVIRDVQGGSSTGLQLLADFQFGGSKFHITTTGDFSASGAAITTSSGIITAKGFRPPGWSANTTIFVDGTNGTDSTGNGSQTNPFKTIAHAASIASSGNLILVGPGTTYTANTQIVLPNGVSLKGMGVGVTILKPNSTWTAGLAALIVPGNSSDISDMTVDLTASSSTNRPACIGCSDSATGGSAQFGLNATIHRVKCINTGSCVEFVGASTSGTSYLYLEDCIWVSNGRCTQWTMTPGTLSVDEFRCQHLWTCATSAGATNLGECAFAQGNPSRFFNCLFSMTDTVNTSWTNLSYQCIDADAPVEIYGSHFITNFPNLPAPSLTATAGSDPGYWAFSNTSAVKLGAGCTVNPMISDIGQSLYMTLQSPAPHNYILDIVVSSSTATPWGESGNAMFEVAVDAGTLSSNTLTLANVAVGANAGSVSIALADGQKMTVRIKNTNASSTAMTLAFGSTYDTSAFTVATIAAGKKAYLDFVYDADTSKWDLRGYSNGI